jgi:hypothetical protein
MTDPCYDCADRSSVDSVQGFVQAIARHRMATPALLFLVSHRPLAFAAGQLLYTLQPVAELLSYHGCAEIASLLSSPNGARRLEAELTDTDNQI